MVFSALAESDFFFTYGGDLVTSQNANIPKIPAKRAGVIKSLEVNLQQAPGGSAAIFTFKKNGNTIGTVTVNASSTLSNSVLASAEPFVANDILSVEITQVGSGVPGKTATMIMRT